MPPQTQNEFEPIIVGNKKKLPKWLLFIFIILGIFGIFLLIATLITFIKPIVQLPQNNNQNYITATTTDDFADWKTYTNEKYGFELKYPDNVELMFWLKKDDVNVEEFSSGYEKGKTLEGVNVWYKGELSQNQTLAEFERAQRDPKIHPEWKGYQPKYVEKETLVNGQKMSVWIDLYAGGSSYPGNTVVVPFEDNNRIIEINTHISKDNTQIPEFFSQILSTFKFISTSTPAN